MKFDNAINLKRVIPLLIFQTYQIVTAAKENFSQYVSSKYIALDSFRKH